MAVSAERCPLCRGETVEMPRGGDADLWLRCLVCSNVFGPGQTLENRSPARSRKLVRQIAEPPEGMWIQRTPSDAPEAEERINAEAARRDDIVIRWSRSRTRDSHRVLAALVWDVLAYYFAVYALEQVPQVPPLGWLVVVFFGALTLRVNYRMAALLFNTTTIWVRGHRLSVWEGPFPLYSRRNLEVGDIFQLWVEQNADDSARDPDAEGFAIMARTRQEERMVLLPRMDTIRQACWVEQQVEDCLGIIDVAVEGEVSPAT